MNTLLLILFTVLTTNAVAQSPWYFGADTAVNLTPSITFSNGVMSISGSLNPSSVAVSAPAGSVYLSTNGFSYVKQDSGSSTNWTRISYSTGDVVGPASAVDSQVSLFDGTTGKLLRASTASGVAKLSSGVLSASNVGLTSEVTGVLPVANGGTNSSTALSGSSIMVSNGTSVVQGSAGTATTVLHGNASGSPSYGAVSLTADVSGVLPLANGGTNKNMTAVAGGVVWTDGDSMEVIAAGTSGYVLQSNGTSAPSWVVSATNTKTCYLQTGGAGSLTAQTVCTSSPCTEYVDNCTTLSMTRGGTGDYLITGAAGTCKANGRLWCSVVAGNNANYINATLLPTSTMFATDASGGFTWDFDSFISGGGAANTFHDVACDCEVP